MDNRTPNTPKSRDELSSLRQHIADLQAACTNYQHQLDTLRAEREHFRIIADFTYDWEYWRAPDGSYPYVSPACRRITGYRPEEFQADPGLFEHIVHPDDRDLLTHHLHDEQDQKGSYELEFRILTSSGEERWIGHACQAVYGNDREWLGQRASNRDITRRKQTEATLHEQQHFIQQVADVVPGIIYIYDVLSRENVYSNRRIVDILGYTVEDVQAMGDAFISSLLHPEDQQPYLQHLELQAQSAEDKLLSIEYRMRHRDGSWRWLISRETIFARTDSGQVQQILGMAYDITRRKQTEEQLRVFKTLVEYSSAGIGITSLNGIITYANPAYSAMLNYGDDLIGQQLTDTYAEPPDYVMELVQLTAEQGSWSGELAYKTKDGSSFPAQIKAFALRDKQDRVVNVAGIIQDITERKEAEAALRVSEERYREFVEGTSDLVVQVDQDGRFLYVNPTAERIFGLSAESCIGRFAFDFIHPDDRAHTEQAFAEWAQQGASTISFENRTLNRNTGTTHSLLWTINPQYDTGGTLTTINAIASDITRQKQLEAALRQSQAHLQALFDNAAVGICQFTPNGHWQEINERGQRMLGYTQEELASFVYLDIIHPAERAHTLDLFAAAFWLERSQHRIERRYIRKDGSVFWGDLSLNAIYNDAGQVTTILGILVNITRSKEAEAALQRANQQLQQQVIRDSLTGLYNRRYLDETLPRELQRAERQGQQVGVIMLDIDHFKHFNDTYGHDAGDVVLRAAGTFLKTHTRGEDIACRYGGEEFTLVLPGASLEDTRQRAEAIRQGIQSLHVDYGGQALPAVTVSVGIAVFSDVRSTATLLIKAADQALYQAKRTGRDRVVVAGRTDDA